MEETDLVLRKDMTGSVTGSSESENSSHDLHSMENGDKVRKTDTSPQNENVKDDVPCSNPHQNGPAWSLRHLFSVALTLFCLVMVTTAIFTKQTKGTAERNIPTFLAFLLFWALIIWLAFMEGSLNCIVGLKPINRDLYRNSHPLTYRCTSLTHDGENTERFIVGRQYLDLMCVFLTSVMVSSIDGASILGFPGWMNEIFLGAGLAVVLVTIIFGQLVAQINAAHSMLDFMNNYLLVGTVYVALAVEASGILHAVYLVQILFSKLSGKAIENDLPKTAFQKFFFWLRVALSTSLVVGASVITMVALYNRQTTAWDSLPPSVSFVILIVLIFIGGLLEGLQIAIFKVLHMPKEDLQEHKVASSNCNIVFAGKLERLLVGRQIIQTILMFLIAKISTVKHLSDSSESLFGLENSFISTLFDTGVAGALISTVIASLSWRVLANSFPFLFLSNPFAYWIIKLCLFMESTGVCYSAWILAEINRRFVKYNHDEVYIGKAAGKEDDVLHLAELNGSYQTDTDELVLDTSK